QGSRAAGEEVALYRVREGNIGERPRAPRRGLLEHAPCLAVRGGPSMLSAQTIRGHAASAVVLRRRRHVQAIPVTRPIVPIMDAMVLPSIGPWLKLAPNIKGPPYLIINPVIQKLMPI